MKIILRENKTDPDMVDIITKTNNTKKEMLWAVAHIDILYGEENLYDELKENKELFFNLTLDL